MTVEENKIVSTKQISACLYLVRNSLKLKESRNITFDEAWILGIIK